MRFEPYAATESNASTDSFSLNIFPNCYLTWKNIVFFRDVSFLVLILRKGALEFVLGYRNCCYDIVHVGKVFRQGILNISS